MRTAFIAGVCCLASHAERHPSVTKPMGDGRDAGMFFQQTAFMPVIDGQVGQTQVSGHVLKVKNPAGRVALVPPLPGGCGTLQEMPETAKRYGPKCGIAVNAGYFDLHDENKWGCLGNVVSDGKILGTGPMETSNVNFGILKNGSFVIGYITPEEVEMGRFQQLVAGLGWIVRNGKNTAQEGWDDAYHGASNAGDKYINLRTARNAVGFDKDGGLIIAMYDGFTHNPKWGATLVELADKMIDFGAVEAINLDGGGSAQFWKHGEHLNYGYERAEYGVLDGYHLHGCPIGHGKGNLSAFPCPREVSTILCIDDRDVTVIGDESPRLQSNQENSSMIANTGFLVVGLAVGVGSGLLISVLMKRRGHATELSEEDSEE